MKILVTGASGQLGFDVVKHLKTLNHEVIGTSSQDLDITNAQQVQKFIENLKPDAVVHCAAYTAVDNAEDDYENCYKVNTLGTKHIAAAAQSVGAKLVYISTDYVFNGQGDQFFETTEKTAPLSVYGKTKLLGEQEATTLCNKTFVVRISWVFGINGKNFVKTMLSLSETRKELNVVADQIGSPTYTVDLAKLIAQMLETEKYGIYHATNEDICSWHEFATAIFKEAGINDMKLTPVKTEEYPAKAARPKNSRLSKDCLENAGFNRLPTWQDALKRYIKELKGANKYLITGGAGFIGGNFCHYMLEKYPFSQFVCLDALTYAGNMETLADIIDNPNFKFVKGNICDKALVENLFETEKFDYVINFAAETHVDRSIENPKVFLESNIIGVQTLMDACRKYGIKRFHQVSTDEVYGDLPLDRPDLFFTENTPIHTSSPYSASKAGADLLVQAYHRTFKLPVTISRCSNNYGAYQFPEKLIPLIISKALKNQPLPVYGKGENVRDWLHVLDHCSAIDLIIHNAKDGEIFNVGGHNERTNLEVVKTILKALNKPESLITYVTDRPGHDRRYAINPEKLERELGWKPKYNFESGILETIKWNVDNADWLKNVESGEYKNWLERHYN